MRSLTFYTKTAPAILRIFDTFSKTTFATLSPRKQDEVDGSRSRHLGAKV